MRVNLGILAPGLTVPHRHLSHSTRLRGAKRFPMLIRTVVAACCLLLAGVASAEDYKLGPDSQRQEGVPQGKITQHNWTSKIFPGTTRDYWVYVPAQYKPESPACVMVFQDGKNYLKGGGGGRGPGGGGGGGAGG